MIQYTPHPDCAECKKTIDNRVFDYSTKNFGYPLCLKCQDWLRDIYDTTSATKEAITLYFALKQRKVPATLEKPIGYATIDIAVPHAKVNIEVDGAHHNFKAKQAKSDLKRTLYAFKKGYSTLRIPNSLVKNDLQETADLITQFLIESREQKNSK